MVDTSKPAKPGGCAQGCLVVTAIFVGLGILGAIGSAIAGHHDDSSTASSSSDTATDAPTAKPDMHAARATIHDWWEKAIYELAFSDESLTLAREAVAQDDLPGASSLISQGRQYAKQAVRTAGNDRPDGWDDVSQELGEAASEFDDGLGHLSDYIDSQKPSDGAAALQSSDDAKERLDQATHDGRVRYESMGGKWSDLDDVATESALVDKVIKELSQ
jgi:hypothetical protein